MTPIPHNEKAAAEMIGAILLISIFCLVIAIIAVGIFSQPPPQKIPSLSVIISNNSQTINIYHNGGDPMLKDEMQVLLNGEDYTKDFQEDGVPVWSTWAVGQSLTYNVTFGSPIPSLIQIVYKGGGISQLIASSGEGSGGSLPVPAPVVTGITPNSGNVGTTVHITNLAGSYFFSGATVKLTKTGQTDIVATGVNVVSSTQITCDFNLASATLGAWDVVVTNPGGPSGTLANGFTVTTIFNPTFTNVTPNSGSTAGGTFVTIKGTNFIGATSATFGGSAATNLSVVSSTTITATTTSHAAQTIDVVIVTPNGTVTGTNAYTYVAPPTFVSIAPTYGPTAGGTIVTITGTNLIGATAVSIGGNTTTGFSVVSGTSITATTPFHAAAGAVDVVITTPNGTATGAGAFTYVAPPTFVSIAPTYGPTAGGTIVTITGTNLIGATAVSIGGNTTTGFSVVSGTSITATTPFHAAAGTVDVTVTTPNGTATGTGAFTYVAPPTYVSIAPTSGTTLGGTPVTITGTNLIGMTGVTFDGIAATNLSVVSSTTITASTPAHAAGAVDVVITTPNGTATGTNAYTYVYVAPPPTFNNINPTYGSTLGVTSVTIVGTNLIGASSVTFGGTAATNLSVVSTTTITASTPAHATGAVDVVITTPNGTATGTNAFTYYAVPIVTDVTPKKGPIIGGTIVTITGTGFTGATAVKFGSTNAPLFTVNSATQITVTSPAGSSAGPVDVTVTSPGGTSAISQPADIFRYFVIQSFTTVGTTSWPVPAGVTTVEYLVVAGGGGGGRYGAGGGAGGFRNGTLTGLSGSQTVTVGNGGAGGLVGLGTNGQNSVFASITSTGGGGGAGNNNIIGGNGGSGGGGFRSTGTVGTGIAGQGFAGGMGFTYLTNRYNGGGGGGASAVGDPSTASTDGGYGGAGKYSDISGTNTQYACGGGGGGRGAAGTGGCASAGNGVTGNNVGGNAAANFGGGGGGGGNTANGGNGGSGIVIIMYY